MTSLSDAPTTEQPRTLPAGLAPTPLGAYDDALALLLRFDPEYVGYLSNHAPMVVEALARRGNGEQILPWTQHYAQRLVPLRPLGGATIDEESWRSHLGDRSVVTDWILFFQGLLDQACYLDLVATWVPRLVPGAVAAAGHGLIRTAHALRAVASHDTPLRRTELAHAVGYWASCWVPMPQLAPRGTLPWEEALRAVPSLPHPAQGFAARRDALASVPGFADAVRAAAGSTPDWGGMLRAIAHEVTADGTQGPVMPTHALTAATSLHTLAAFLPAHEQLLHDTAWTVAAAVHAMYPEHHADPRRPILPTIRLDMTWEQALSSGDEHDLKRVDALLTARELTTLHPTAAH